MYYEDEQDADIIGCLCTLLTPYKGHTEGEVSGRLRQRDSGKAHQRQGGLWNTGRSANL